MCRTNAGTCKPSFSVLLCPLVMPFVDECECVPFTPLVKFLTSSRDVGFRCNGLLNAEVSLVENKDKFWLGGGAVDKVQDVVIIGSTSWWCEEGFKMACDEGVLSMKWAGVGEPILELKKKVSLSIPTLF